MLELFTGRSKRYEPWIGVDLDGTLAYAADGGGVDTIGEPIWPMVRRIKKAMASGKKFKIFTARAADPKQVPKVKEWVIKKAGLGALEVTNQKDPGCEEIWDDKARRVPRNSGIVQ